MRKFLQGLASFYSHRERRRRAKIFLRYLRPSKKERILDLGSWDGSHLASILPFRDNVTIADIDQRGLDWGRKHFGFQTVLLDGSDTLPFPDQFFDITFCSSVIEHVTIDRSRVYTIRSSKDFAKAATVRQHKFASEIRRVSKRYFVQTPNKYFLLESHTWLPVIIIFLPRHLYLSLISFFNRWWPKKTLPDWYLLTQREMRELFPDADIVVEKSFGMKKSIMAIKY